MKFHHKKRITQKLWGWICLAINCLTITVYLTKIDTTLLTGGIVLSVLIIGYGILKTKADMLKNDLSGVSVAIQYIGLYLLTFLSALKAKAHLSSLSLLAVLAAISIVELLVFAVITGWHPIRRFFSQKRKKSHKKS